MRDTYALVEAGVNELLRHSSQRSRAAAAGDTMLAAEA